MSRSYIIHVASGRDDEFAAAAATDLATLTSGLSGFIGGPLVRRPFFVRGTPPLAGDFTLLVWRHRSKSSAFFASVHGTPPGYWATTYGPFCPGSEGGSWTGTGGGSVGGVSGVSSESRSESGSDSVRGFRGLEGPFTGAPFLPGSHASHAPGAVPLYKAYATREKFCAVRCFQDVCEIHDQVGPTRRSLVT